MLASAGAAYFVFCICICILSRGAGKAWLDLRITPAAARHRLHAHALNPGLGPQHHNQHRNQQPILLSMAIGYDFNYAQKIFGP